jgi:hypothetical protein
VYRREFEGQVLTFGVSGNLLKNALVMYDREKEGLWSHFTGEGLKGHGKGKVLGRLASVPKITWKAWRAENPQTLVLSSGNSPFGYSDYSAYFASDDMGLFPPASVSDLAPPKDMVLGISDDPPAAYHLPSLERAGDHPIERGGRKAVIFAGDDGLFGAAYLPEGTEELKLAGRTLRASDGRTWSALTGAGKDGSLEMIPLLPSFWFAWHDHYPDTEFWPERGI